MSDGKVVILSELSVMLHFTAPISIECNFRKLHKGENSLEFMELHMTTFTIRKVEG